LQLLFFDGEEPLPSNHHSTLTTNSLYGSRHLAQKWETNMRNNVDIKHRTSKLKSKQKYAKKISSKVRQRLVRSWKYLCRRYPSSRFVTNLNDITGNLDDEKSNQGKRDPQWSVSETLARIQRTYHTISNIKLLLLLDLLGGSNPRFYNTNPQTGGHFSRLVQIG